MTTQILPNYALPSFAAYLAHKVEHTLNGAKASFILPDNNAFCSSSIQLPFQESSGNPLLIRYMDLDGVSNGGVHLEFQDQQTVVTEIDKAFNWLGQHVLSHFGSNMLFKVPPAYQDNLKDAEWCEPHKTLGDVDWTLLNALTKRVTARAHLQKPFCFLSTHSHTEHYSEQFVFEQREPVMHKEAIRLPRRQRWPKLEATMIDPTILQIASERCREKGNAGRRVLHFDTLNPQTTVEHVLATCNQIWRGKPVPEKAG